MIVPAKRQQQLGELANAVQEELGPGAHFLAMTSTKSQEFVLAVAQNLSVVAEFTLGLGSIFEAMQGLGTSGAEARTLLVFGGYEVGEGSLRQVLDQLALIFPKADIVGMAATGTSQEAAAMRASGRSLGTDEIQCIALAPATSVSLVECGFEPFGPTLEVFDAQLARNENSPSTKMPWVLKTIGTLLPGDIAEHTHPGCSIPRRKGLPAAQALQAAMFSARDKISSPREVWIGVPGSPESNATPVTIVAGAGGQEEAWSLFPLLGMKRDGDVLLGGRGPLAEGLAPKGFITTARCFRLAAPAPAATSASDRTVAAFAPATLPPMELQRVVGEASSFLPLVGRTVLYRSPGSSASWHARSVALVELP